MVAPRVLVVDDDLTVAEVVVSYLRRAGYEPRHVADGPGALAAAEAWLPDLVVLDLMLPGIDGVEVCRRLRARPTTARVPVIMLTALGDEADRVLGLEVGADDYVTKPFSPRELVLRVQSVLRRSQAGPPGTGGHTALLHSGRIDVDVVARQARKDGVPLALTVREFDLLAFLAANPGRAFSRDDLMKQVWGWSYGDQSTVTVHVRRLREKVEDEPTRPRQLVTVWGVGYRWEPETDTRSELETSPPAAEPQPQPEVDASRRG
jgi:two-component system, OmpR family, response regulator ResD